MTGYTLAEKLGHTITYAIGIAYCTTCGATGAYGLGETNSFVGDIFTNFCESKKTPYEDIDIVLDL